MGTGQREVRPVWNNAMRTNHQNFSNSIRNFAPTAVLTKSGLVPISTARQNSSRTAATVSAARPIKTAAPKPFVNVAKSRSNAFQKLHSPSRRPFYQQTALKNKNLNNKVNTVKVNSVNTAKGKRVTSVVGEQGIDVVNVGSTTQQMVINSPRLTDKKELAILGQTTTGEARDVYYALKYDWKHLYHQTKGVKHIGKSKEVRTLRYLSLVVPLTKVGDEAVHKELGDRMERAATTASSFEAEQDSGGYTPVSDEGSKKLNELTELCIKLSEKVKHLEDQLKSTTKRRKELNLKMVRDVTVAYQSFEDMLKGFDREDLVALWSLVKERFRFAESTEDMEKALWVELKRLFEPDKDDVLWKLQRYMHDPLTWRLYGACGVHHISSTRGHDIYMLTVKKNYPLSTTVMGLMLGKRLQVEEDSEVARDLVMKIFIEANKPRS
ncbi:hypothetical protein Tco_1438198 [Tanacetum coccineum]